MGKNWPYNTARWRKLRAMHLAIEPMCRGCAPHRLTPANHVDHITAISDGGHPFPSHEGLASYCLPCHSRKTARGNEAGAIKTNKPMKGCDADGNPLDAAHPWAEKSLRAGPREAMGDSSIELVSSDTSSDQSDGR